MNHNIILKMAITLLANDMTKNLSKNTKQLKVALDFKFRETLWGL